MDAKSAQFVNHDIYLIDQILKERFSHFKTILDVGCGNGRNISYFFQNGYEVYGIDPDQNRIDYVKKIAVQNQVDPEKFKVGIAENIPFETEFDLIICNAVLHFAKDSNQFEKMLYSIWNKLSNKGILFIRLASDIGIEDLVEDLGNRNYKLPDQSTRYLVNQSILLDYTTKLNAQLLEPIKTTNVQNLRCMTTWILRK